jgi:hypothetical protein
VATCSIFLIGVWEKNSGGQAPPGACSRQRTEKHRHQTGWKEMAMHHRRRKHVVFALWTLLLSFIVVPQDGHTVTLAAAQAKDHVGETATVCGVVANATFAVRTTGQPTFLNLDQPYPSHIFTALIWGSDRLKFGQPEVG